MSQNSIDESWRWYDQDRINEFLTFNLDCLNLVDRSLMSPKIDPLKDNKWSILDVDELED